MSDGKHHAIKLFGKTIQLPGALTAGVDSQEDGAGLKTEDRSVSSSYSSEAESKEVRESDDNNKDIPIDKEDESANSTVSEEMTEPNATSLLNENSKTPSAETESATAKESKAEEELNEEKTLMKPDKILPCPRCDSMDTKFCYYNNYNVNQPRHFCKNCRRYWTAGGSMRNVPVGAGRRKNKTSASQYHQLNVTEALPGGLSHTVLKPNGTVLTFGSDTPSCESMSSVLNIPDPDPSNNDVTEMQNLHVFSHQIPCFSGAPWPYQWNPQMGPAICPPGFPIPVYPAAPYWGCAIPVPVPGPGPGPWNMQWVPPPANYHPAPLAPPGPISPTLGKHSRAENGDEETTKENEPEKSLWVPKTLRIDNPDKAAKSSVLQTLGIKDDISVGGKGRGMFKVFQSKSKEKKQTQETSTALQANPAALSRSFNFQEIS